MLWLCHFMKAQEHPVPWCQVRFTGHKLYQSQALALDHKLQITVLSPGRREAS